MSNNTERRAKNGTRIGKRSLNQGNKTGRNPLPPADKKVPLQFYLRGGEIERVGGREQARAIAIAAIAAAPTAAAAS